MGHDPSDLRKSLHQTLVPLAADKLPKVLRFMEAMEDLDDVQNVWANFDAEEEALAAAHASG